ncbi:MAG: sugar system component [Campylobacterota bacterium]|nr:sugar system component [Campylobacterota bacterium]
MFGFFKRKTREIKSPVDGEVVALESVKDDVFSQKMVGDGVAVVPMSEIFTAPIDGVIARIFPTNHAYTVKSDKDLTVMVHIGLDTVALEGKGFERLADEGDRVSSGDPIIRADLAYLRQYAKDIITPVIISDESDVKKIEKKYTVVKSGDIIMEVI